MSQPVRTASTDSNAESMRKRVCKACDRCRLKKSKCDGSHPCSRCKADNAICVFGERKKSHDKVYPKGYVEMLEQQQSQLVAGLQEMYHRLLDGQSWSGPQLVATNGQPLTHDILAALNLLEPKEDNSGEMESFEEDCEKLQSRLLAEGAPYVQRRGSFSSESEHSQHGHSRSVSNVKRGATKPTMFQETLTFTPSPSPLSQSPVPQSQKVFTAPQQAPLQPLSPLSAGDPQFYEASWARGPVPSADAFIRSKYALQTPNLDDEYLTDPSFLSGPWDELSPIDMGGTFGFQSYSQGFPSGNGAGTLRDFGLDPMELDLSKPIQVTT